MDKVPGEAFQHQHDHHRCIKQALDSAQELCRMRNSRLTPIRKRVLELIWQSHKPLGAYHLLSMLTQEGHNSAPPTIYRALDFLLEQQLVHRIASLNAYTGCVSPEMKHHGYFLICRECGTALELEADAISRCIRQSALTQQFLIESETVEVSGLCPSCRSDNEIGQGDVSIGERS
jgi:Fur family zinc uptake transcriptional regulator